MGCGCGGTGNVKTLALADAPMMASNGPLVWVVTDRAGNCLISELGACVTFATRHAATQAANDAGGQVQPVTLENDDA